MKKNVTTDWLVLYTRSRWEKKIHQQLSEQKISSYCPIVRTESQWADRKKMVDLPLFSSYVFVQPQPTQHNRILQVPGVINYLTFCGKPATVKNDEIERIQLVLKTYNNIESIPLSDLNVGDTVMVKHGPLLNHRGEVKQIQGRKVVMVIQHMNCALTVKIDQKHVVSSHMTS